MKKDKLGRRILMSVLGVVVGALSVGIFKLAAFGVDPFQTFMAGLDSVVPISFGTLYVIANAILLLFSLFADKHRIGLATVINLFGVGYITQYTYAFLQEVFPNITVVGRLIALAIALVIMCFSSAMYYTADLGVSTYDAVALVLSENWKIGKFKYIRITTDFCCVALGVVLFLISGSTLTTIVASIGIGTILTAFCMGPLIAFFRTKVSEPLLNRS